MWLNSEPFPPRECVHVLLLATRGSTTGRRVEREREKGVRQADRGYARNMVLGIAWGTFSFLGAVCLHCVFLNR